MEEIENVINYNMPPYWRKILNVAKSNEDNYRDFHNDELLKNLIKEYNTYGYIKKYTLKLKLQDILQRHPSIFLKKKENSHKKMRHVIGCTEYLMPYVQRNPNFLKQRDMLEIISPLRVIDTLQLGRKVKNNGR